MDLVNFLATLNFKTGNVSGKFELNIDQIMITNGKIQPKYRLYNFENPANNPFIVDGEASTSGFNLGSSVVPFQGNGYFTVKKAATGTWKTLESSFTLRRLI